jgi:hypothetical protein
MANNNQQPAVPPERGLSLTTWIVLDPWSAAIDRRFGLRRSRLRLLQEAMIPMILAQVMMSPCHDCCLDGQQ